MSWEPQGESCFLTPSNSPLHSWWGRFIAKTSSKFSKAAKAQRWGPDKLRQMFWTLGWRGCGFVQPAMRRLSEHPPPFSDTRIKQRASRDTINRIQDDYGGWGCKPAAVLGVCKQKPPRRWLSQQDARRLAHSHCTAPKTIKEESVGRRLRARKTICQEVLQKREISYHVSLWVCTATENKEAKNWREAELSRLPRQHRRANSTVSILRESRCSSAFSAAQESWQKLS